MATNLSALVTSYSPYAALFYNTEGLPYFSVVWATSAFRLRRARECWAGLPPAAVPPQHSAAWVASEPRWAAVLGWRAFSVRHFGRRRFGRQTGGAGVVGRWSSAGDPTRRAAGQQRQRCPGGRRRR